MAVVSAISLVEWKLVERISYSDAPSVGFVVESVRGVLAGTPVSKSWAHRFLGPLLVSALGGATPAALFRFAIAALFLTNLVLFALVWRQRGRARARDGVLAVLALAALHVLLAYKLEYPWDGTDQLLFVIFGAQIAAGARLSALTPLLVVGALNHETVLYMPAFYLLGATSRRERGRAALALGALGAVIGGVRTLAYRGRPDLPGQVYESALPLIENHMHIAHNAKMLFVEDWRTGRAHLAAGFLLAAAAFIGIALRGTTRQVRRAGAWSLVALGTVVAFGYVNETRHALVLAAFWVAFLATAPPPSTAPSPDEPIA